MQVAEMLCQHLSLLDSKTEERNRDKREGIHEKEGAEGTEVWIKKDTRTDELNRG